MEMVWDENGKYCCMEMVLDENGNMLDENGNMLGYGMTEDGNYT